MGPQALKADTAGLVLVIYSLVKLAAGPVAGWSSDRVSPRRIACLAILLAAVASFVFVFNRRNICDHQQSRPGGRRVCAGNRVCLRPAG